jgi:hypothetical protein
VSFTFDAWTSQVGDPYLSITAHFVHGVGANWKLRSEQLAFTPLPGRHSGANIGNAIMQTIDRYGLWEKVHCSLMFSFDHKAP